MLIETGTFKVAAYTQGNPEANSVALVLPGRLDTKDYAHMRSHVEFLAGLGHYAMSFDPPGVWESPGSIEDYTTTNYLKAIHEIIESLGNRPTILVGHSRGGGMAMLAGTTNPHVTHIVAIMSHHGPTQSNRPVSEGAPVQSFRDLPPGTERTAEQKEFLLPYSYFIDQEQYDSIDELRTCAKPKLFFYGTDDNLVSPASVQRMYNESAAPKMIHALRSEHDYRLHPEIIAEVNQILQEFLETDK